MSGFVHLHCHTEGSLLDGACRITEFVEKAKFMGFPSIAITDHGNVDMSLRFVKECKRVGIKPIIGCELYVVKDRLVHEKQEKRLHCVYLCRNFDGFKSLMKMITASNMDGFFYRPRVDKGLLTDNFNSKNAVLMTGCSSGILGEPWGAQMIKGLYYADDNPDSVFVELMVFKDPKGLDYFENAYNFAVKMKMNCVITNDIHYLEQDDWQFHEALLAVGTKKKKKDPDRWKMGEAYNGQLYMKSEDTIEREAKENLSFIPVYKIDEAIENTMKIAELCSGFEMPKLTFSVPDVFPGKNPDSLLRSLCITAMEDLGLNEKTEYWYRFEYEMSRIVSMGFSNTFLMVADYINWAKEHGILVGPGRGSVGSSLVAFLLKITTIDPLRFDLLFDRFISEGRIDLPDIDVDFEDTKRHQIEKYIRGKYGDKNCAFVNTFLTYHGKMALKDASRYMDVPFMEVNNVSKLMENKAKGDEREDLSALDFFNENEEAKAFMEKYPEASEYAIKLEGRSKTVGVHAAGFVVSREPLDSGERCCLVKRKDKIAINWDKYVMEDMGLLKLDLLGLSNLSVLREAADFVKERTGEVINYYDIDVEGPESREIYREFNAGNTVGIFQFGTPGFVKMCREVGVKSFRDLYDINALNRPGTLRSGMVDVYKERKLNGEPIPKVCKEFDEITASTYGIILYQDQLLLCLNKVAGLPWPEADALRKVVSKSQGVEVFKKWEKRFVDGCLAAGTLSEAKALELFEQLTTFGAYGFVKPHAVEYSWVAYWCMYMKVYHPTEYMCALFNYVDKEERLTQYVKEAMRMGIKIQPPDARYSGPAWAIADNNTIVAPITCVKMVGDSAATKFVEIQKRYTIKGGVPFEGSEWNPQVLMDLATMGKAAFLNMARVGAFDFLEIDFKTLAENYAEDMKGKVKTLTIGTAPDGTKSGFTGIEREQFIEDLIEFEVLSGGGTKIKKLRERLSTGIDVPEITEGMTMDTGEEFNLLVRVNQIKFVTKDDKLKCFAQIEDRSGTGTLFMHRLVIENKRRDLDTVTGKFILADVRKERSGFLCLDYRTFDEVCSGRGNYGLLDESTEEILEWTENHREIIKGCGRCKLKDERSSGPRLYRQGGYNMMIVSDLPLSTSVEDVLFGELRKYGLRKDQFWVDSIMKCTPKDWKLDNCKELIPSCTVWLKAAIAKIRPYVIFSLGKYSKEFFSKSEDGIMKMNGRVEWSVDHGCWIIYGINPVMVISKNAAASSISMFSAAVEKFYDVAYDLGTYGSE